MVFSYITALTHITWDNCSCPSYCTKPLLLASSCCTHAQIVACMNDLIWFLTLIGTWNIGGGGGLMNSASAQARPVKA